MRVAVCVWCLPIAALLGRCAAARPLLAHALTRQSEAVWSGHGRVSALSLISNTLVGRGESDLVMDLVDAGQLEQASLSLTSRLSHAGAGAPPRCRRESHCKNEQYLGNLLFTRSFCAYGIACERAAAG